MCYRILSFDGGGIRGLLTAILLERIAAEFPQLIANVDLIAGTSTGGIIALGLSNGMSPAEIARFYRDDGAAIFHASWVREAEDLGDLIGAKYDNTPLFALLKARFSAQTLGNLQKMVLIPSFDLDNKQDPRYKRGVDDGSVMRTWKPKFFHNYPVANPDVDQLVVDVAMRTSAAPTYFPSYGHYIDGGVVANNPSMAALAQALDAKTGKQQLGNLRLLSIGTGAVTQHIGGDDHNWGVVHWAYNIVPLMMDGLAGVADYQCQRLLGTSYCRLQPELHGNIPMDDVSLIPTIVDFAQGANIDATVAWLKSNWA